jgi:hypothetical protein
MVAIEPLLIEPDSDIVERAGDINELNGECSENGPRQHQLHPSNAPPNRQRRNRHATRNYILFNVIAFVLTLSCPSTYLWADSMYDCNLLIPSSNATSTDNGAPNNIRCESFATESSVLSDQFVIGLAMLYGKINIYELVKFMMHIIAVIVSFLSVHHSNPGILTEEAMTRLNGVDNFDVFVDQKVINSNITPGGENTGMNSEFDDMERQSFLEPAPTHPLPTNTPQSKPESRDGQTTLCRSTRRKYCTKCNIHPPLRSHHCRICNACVATFDHHCLFLDTCIGERNHFRFWVFLLLNVIGLHNALRIVGSGHVPKSLQNQQLRSWGVLILIAARFYFYPILFVGNVLFTIHTLLMVTNSTSFEFGKASGHIDYLRGTRMMDFPFAQGLCGNLRLFYGRDDVSNRFRRCRNQMQSRAGATFEEQSLDGEWTPILWRMPNFIERDSEEWWNHPWQNKYWSCC